jgi:hypothetical protein
MEGFFEGVGVARLGEVVVGAELDGFDRRGHRAVAGEHHGAQAGEALDEVFEHLEPALALEAEVDHRELGTVHGGEAQGGAVVGGGDDGVAAVGELQLHRLTEGIVVVDHQQLLQHVPSSLGPRS